MMNKNIVAAYQPPQYFYWTIMNCAFQHPLRQKILFGNTE